MTELTYESLIEMNNQLKREKPKIFSIYLNEAIYKIKFFSCRYENIHRCISNANYETDSFKSHGRLYVKVKDIRYLND